ncbi:non-ribosomal peptide synthetase [Actinokineospora cianjurensis]|uniref:Non-ribosomal peptide synthase protein (TIGR01720 family)/amino acid adenylation domain-containing protein n=1 Tax=Actinokineospora cianjurensis TaxID=585224 RepID=A0A421AYG9_9PSEU|nr:non-ribosomal peptide synthetase [Actinokineospora cianjurensis]RLK54870.1 non-ribosomal peptide synthase protein (TIGR01720 family)/amino acid adenylation domain-containing protein [Actinokineospora cianjurensis]
MSRAGLQDIWPLSPLQEGLLFLSGYDESEVDVYTVQTVLEVEGPLDAGLMREAVGALLRRHPNLRVCFSTEDADRPVQLVPARVAVPWAEIETTEAEWPAIVERDRATRFDLASPPLIRFLLARIGPDRHRLLVTNHHILLDGWSTPLLLGELFEIYGARGDTGGLRRVRPFRDYLVWLSRQDRDLGEKTWAEALDGVTEPTLVGPPGAANSGALTRRVPVGIAPDLAARLGEVARALRVTVNTLLQTAWGLVLARHLGRGDVVFGATVSGRPADLPGAESMIGLFINTVPVRVRLDPAETAAELLARVQAEQARVMDHQYVGLSRVQRHTGLPELFDTITVFESYPVDTEALGRAENAAGLRVVGVQGTDDTNYPLTLTAEASGGLDVWIDHRPDVISGAETVRFATRLVAALTAFVTDSATPVRELDLLTAEERTTLAALSRGVTIGVGGTSVLQAFAASVSAAPEAPAVVDTTDSLAFAELDARSDLLAGWLQSQGVTSEAVVASMLPRTADAVIALLAIWKAGAVHLPVDPGYPAERIRYMLEDARPALVLSSIEDHMSAALTPVPVTGAAYMIYTSGSTGKPKGVVVEHAGLVNLLAAHRVVMRPGPVLHAASFSFDASLDPLLWLFAGHTLHIADGDLMRDTRVLVEYVRTRDITYLDAAPSLLTQLVADGLLDSGVSVVGTGGEAVGAALWRDLATSTVEAFNFYGPTESTVDAVVAPIAGTDVVIGRPVANSAAYVLDPALSLVAPGVVGELYVGGAGVARGYWEQPGLTASRFVANPFGAGRLYRTGDLVRWNPSGSLEFLGRADDQVKVRGFRVELGEVEAVLAEVAPRVTAVVRDSRLVAYVVGVSAETVREHAKAVLPEHMVPSAVVVVDEFPLLPSGKINRAALPDPDLSGLVTASREPRTPTESVLHDLFAGVLGLPAVGMNDDFFTLGGDSIVSIQLVSRARAAGVTLSPRDVFEQRTVAALAAVADAKGEPVVVEEEGAAVGIVPLTPIMHDLLANGGPINRYAQVQVLVAPTDLTEARLTTTVQKLLDTHVILRARLTQEGLDIPTTADAADAVAVVSGVLDVDGVLDTLDPAASRVLRVAWFPDAGAVVVAAHHLVVDGVSWRILLPDLVEAYEGADLQPIGTSFRRWAQGVVKAAASASELPHWNKTLAGDDPLLGSRALDPAADTLATAKTARTEIGALPTEVAARFTAEIDDVLLAGLSVALGRWRGLTSVLLDREAHGRDEDLVPGADLHRTVGWFTSLYPVRLGGIDPRDAATTLKRVKESLRATPGTGTGFGLLRHLNPDTADQLTTKPQLLVNYLGRFEPTTTDAAPWSPVEAGIAGGADKDMPLDHALQIDIVAIGSTLIVDWTWPDGVFTDAEVNAISDHWCDALAELASATGGRTPSDFPLVTLDQAEVDALLVDNVVDIWPLSPLQAGLLFLSGLEGADVYTVQTVLHLDGTVDAARLRAAADALLARHANLRVCFRERANGELVQLVLDNVRAPWQEVTGDESVIAADLDTRFDPATSPLIRFLLLHLPDGGHRLVITNHHVLLDGWSTPLLGQELFELYGGVALSAPRPFDDYLTWLAAQDTDQARTAWAKALDGAEPTLLAGPSTTTVRPEKVDFDLTRALVAPERARTLTARLTEGARALGVTMNTAIQLAWGLVLARHLGREDVVFGATVSGRPADLPGVESMIGLFINTVPVRVRLDPAETVAEAARRVQAEQSALIEHQHLGLADIGRATGLTELFDTLTVFESYPVDTDALGRAEQAAGLRVTGVSGTDATDYPLTLTAEVGETLELSLEYRPDVFDRDTATWLADSLVRVLDTIADDPRYPVRGITLATVPDLAAQKDVGTGPRVTATESVLAVFDRQVATTPDTTAVVDERRELSFAELDLLSRAVAGHLVDRGVRPGDVVGLSMASSADLVAAILGVWRAGAAYLVLDPTYPAERISYMLADAQPTVVLDGIDVTGTYDSAAPLGAAYVLYTSGSTGRPKGVVVEHANLANLLASHRATVMPEQRQRVINAASFAFDASVDGLLWMVAGHELHIVRPDPTALVAYVREHGINYLDAAPVLLALLVEEGLLDTDIAFVGTGGEAVSETLWDQLAASDVTAFNFYGPTETTVDATFARIQSGAPVIGSPVGNTEVYVLNRSLGQPPTGVPGELYIGGAGVTRGYLNQPGLTASRFIPDFLSGAGRLYRTGDLVRWNQSGQLEFLGRVDDQIKVRGFRIEPGEVESALTDDPSVARATVIARDNQLLAYVIAAAGQTPSPTGLRSQLAAVLPEHMVPAAVVVLDEYPTLPSGKVDRKALPSPEYAVGQGRARTPAEEIVASLFAEVLDLPSVGPDDDFFTIGGHSLLATRLVSRLRATVGTELAIRDVFTARTVAGIAALVGSTGDARPALAAVERPQRLPLSFAQQRLWFLFRMEGPSSTNNIPFVARLTGDVDPAALQLALNDLVARHESLRTVFPDHGGVPYQSVLSDVEVPFEVVDGGGVQEATEYAFDLSCEIPVRAWLFRESADVSVIVLLVHHIAADEWSTAPLLGDLGAAYAARRANTAPEWTALPVQYADYTLWQRDLLGSEDDANSLVSKQVAYWRDTLAGAPEEIALPLDRPRPAVASYRGDDVRFDLPAQVAADLRDLARREGVTTFMVVQAAVAALLARLGAGTDIPLGTPIAGRTDENLDRLVGFFVNTLVLRTDVSGDPTFAELLRRVREVDLAAYAHQDVPFERLVEILNPARSMARHPLFHVMVTHTGLDADDLGLPGTETAAQDLATTTAKFDLSVGFSDTPAGIEGIAGMAGSIEYATDLFDRSTVADIADRLVRLLTAVATDPGQSIRTVDLLAADERDLVLRGWNDTAEPEVTRTLPELLTAAFASFPHEIALVSGTARLTYQELDVLVGQLATELNQRGVGPERVVAIGLPRGAEMVIALLAILRAGGAFVPLDPTWPAARRETVLAESGAVLTVTGPGGVAESDLYVDLTSWSFGGHPVAQSDHTHGAQLAYVMFTSGSTGTPKGAMIRHEAISARLVWQSGLLGFGQGDASLFKAPLSFDISVNEILLPLVTGGRLVIAEPGGERDPRYLLDLIDNERVTFVYLPSSMLDALLELAAGTESLRGLRHVWCGGEVLTPDLFDRFRAALDTTMYHGYGPAETTIGVSHVVYREGSDRIATSIGRPNPNTQLYVLDDALNPVQAGIAGELYVGGYLLGRGYVNRPDLTASRFVADPFGALGTRLYRTGDLARWAGDGSLDFVGRADNQVKIRGMRLELEEVESALLAHPGVRSAVVTVPTGSAYLAAYVVADGGADLSDLAAWARNTLPDYMVPSAFVELEALPITANGKVDRKALPDPAVETGEKRAARSPREELVAGIFADLLGLDNVGTDDNFFNLGGHSLLATKLVSRVRSVLGVEPTIRDVFEAPTVAGLVSRLPLSGVARPTLTRSDRPERLPLSFAQQRLWFLFRMEGPSSTYNIPLITRLTGDVDAAALQTALNDVVARHESLRTVFPDHDGVPYQSVLSDVEVPFEVVDGGGVQEATEYTFDLTREIPVRAWLFREAGESVIVLLVHHIAADEWSTPPLLGDLGVAYAARRVGAAPEWAVLPVQYADYTLWQRDLLGSEDDPDSVVSNQVAYWQSALEGMPEELALPVDRPRPPIASYRGGEVTFDLSGDALRGLRAAARANGATLFMATQAAVAALLSRLGAGTDIPLGSPIAGRTDEALDDLVGFFLNTLVLRTDVSGDPTFAELLARVRETDLAAYAHQDVPFERLVEILNPARSMARHPLFQTMVIFHDADDRDLGLPGVTAAEPDSASLDIEVTTARFDLTFTFTELADGITGTVEYADDLFDRATAARLAERLVRFVEAVAVAPADPIGTVDLLTGDERRSLLDFPADPVVTDTIPARFAAQAAATPDAIAVEAGDGSITYGELLTRAEALAGELVRRGAGPERIVALALPRSVDMVVAMLAVLRSGAAYLPLDPEFPADRLEYMVADTDPALLVTTDALRSVLPPIAETVTFADTWHGAVPAELPHVDSPAYVIHTSGSTGRPKGVVVPHGAVANFAEAMGELVGFGPGDRLLAVTTLSFDIAVLELLVPLTRGVTVRVASREEVLDPRLLSGSVTDYVQATPSLWQAVLDTGVDLGATTVLVGGEALPSSLAGALAGRARRVVNLYGPTETTVWSTSAEVVDARVVIGHPIRATQAYVLDSALGLVPDGVVGELYLAGHGVVRGYHRRPDLTASRFVANPYGAGRLYRTGDLVRRTAAGIEYLGRVDDQVKVRGFRIELGEVESVLSTVDEVTRAVVVARDSRLVAYVTPASVDPAALRVAASVRLPEYMVPSAYVTLDAFPLTANGKVNRRALPAPDFTALSIGREPATDRERLLCDLFAEVLGLDSVGADDDFFVLGGHSLLLVRLSAALESHTGVRLPITTLFTAPTPAALAAHLDGGTAANALDPMVELRAGSGVPVFVVHPASGLAWQFAPLKAWLPDGVPLLGLQSPLLTEPATTFDSLTEVAERYAAEITRRQPEGPYRLVGWSFGGNVAYLVAAALRAGGHEVSLLALLDSRHFDPVLDTVPADQQEALEGLLSDLDYPLPDVVTMDSAVAAIHARGDVMSEFDTAAVEAVVTSYLTSQRLLATAEYPSYDGPLLLVDALVPEPGFEAAHYSAADDWRDLAPSLDVVEFACRHAQVVSPKMLPALGEVLSRLL